MMRGLAAAVVVLATAAAAAVTGLACAAPVAPAAAAEDDLQAAIDRARPGDVITLRAGAIYRGPFRLPPKRGDGWIEIRTDATALPPAGTRVGPGDAPLMPKLVSARGAVLVAEPGAHHYRFVGVEIAPAPGVFLYNLVELGGRERARDQVPAHFAFERCYLHGDPAVGARRGIALNSAETTVADSYFTDFKEDGADSQAIAGWNGPGPFLLVNNRFEGAGENVMFGGADPVIPGLVPSDITIRGNHFTKPDAWRQGAPGYEGRPWTVKNLLELKNARRVRIEGNLFERSWAHAQDGFAILFTVRNQDGAAPWSVVEDVVFTLNVVRDAVGGVNLLGLDDNAPSRRTARIRIEDNLFERIGGPGGEGRLFQLLDGTSGVTIAHNTAVHTGPILMADGAAHAGFAFTDNVVHHNEYGIVGTGTAPGEATIARYLPGAVIRGNVIVGGDRSALPLDNFFPRTPAEVGFVDPGRGDYGLGERSRFRGRATDGRDPGVDAARLAAAQARVTSGGERRR